MMFDSDDHSKEGDVVKINHEDLSCDCGDCMICRGILRHILSGSLIVISDSDKE